MSNRTPPEYRTPLRKKDEIARFIVEASTQRVYDHSPHPFCFNVKARRTDFSFDNLLKIYRHFEGDPIYTHDPGWLKAVRQRLEEIDGDHLWQSAVDSARTPYEGRDHELYDGTKVDVQFSFEGRSGGWLSVVKFEGVDFTRQEYLGPSNEAATVKFLMEQDYGWLRKLYALIVMLKHDTRSAKNEIEFQAAETFFHNFCGDIPQVDAVQPELEFAEK